LPNTLIESKSEHRHFVGVTTGHVGTHNAKDERKIDKAILESFKKPLPPPIQAQSLPAAAAQAACLGCSRDFVLRSVKEPLIN